MCYVKKFLFMRLILNLLFYVFESTVLAHCVVAWKQIARYNVGLI